MNELQQFLESLRIEEEKLLLEKTTWGRVEIKTVLELAKSNALLSIMAQKENGQQNT